LQQDLVIPASAGGQKILSDAQVASIRAWWKKTLWAPVRIQLYVDGPGCDSCEVTARVLQQLEQASDKVKVNVALARSARTDVEPFDKLPEIRVTGRLGPAVRFYGTQVGVEVTSLVQTISDVSLESPPLPPDVAKRARSVKEGSWIRVFVGPACTHCPGAVRSAVAVALANPRVLVEVVGVAEFPALGRQFKVGAVPTTVVNGRAYFADPRSPADVLDALLANPPVSV
jgi:alkyl hydroperoxide reductase subunit AhpF